LRQWEERGEAGLRDTSAICSIAAAEQGEPAGTAELDLDDVVLPQAAVVAAWTRGG
jgi:hypothetical protein